MITPDGPQLNINVFDGSAPKYDKMLSDLAEALQRINML